MTEKTLGGADLPPAMATRVNSSNGVGAHWSVSQIQEEDHQVIAHLLITMRFVKQPWIHRVC